MEVAGERRHSQPFESKVRKPLKWPRASRLSYTHAYRVVCVPLTILWLVYQVFRSLKGKGM